MVQLEIQQNLVVALSQISFSAILTQLLHLEGNSPARVSSSFHGDRTDTVIRLLDRFRQHSEGRDEVFVTRVILSVISLILARKGDGYVCLFPWMAGGRTDREGG